MQGRGDGATSRHPTQARCPAPRRTCCARFCAAAALNVRENDPTHALSSPAHTPIYGMHHPSLLITCVCLLPAAHAACEAARRACDCAAQPTHVHNAAAAQARAAVQRAAAAGQQADTPPGLHPLLAQKHKHSALREQGCVGGSVGGSGGRLQAERRGAREEKSVGRGGGTGGERRRQNGQEQARATCSPAYLYGPSTQRRSRHALRTPRQLTGAAQTH